MAKKKRKQSDGQLGFNRARYVEGIATAHGSRLDRVEDDLVDLRKNASMLFWWSVALSAAVAWALWSTTKLTGHLPLPQAGLGQLPRYQPTGLPVAYRN